MSTKREDDSLPGGAYCLGKDTARRIIDEVWSAMCKAGPVGVAVPMTEGSEVRPNGTVWQAGKFDGSFPAPEALKPHTPTHFSQ